MLEYQYTHDQTTSTTGFFSCIPTQNGQPMSLEQGLLLLQKTPNDSFLHRYILRRLVNEKAANIDTLLVDFQQTFSLDKLNICNALLAEIFEINPKLLSEQALAQIKNQTKFSLLSNFSPLVYLQDKVKTDQELQNSWRKVFLKNITAHYKIPSLSEIKLTPLYSEVELAAIKTPKVNLEELYQKYKLIEKQNSFATTVQTSPKEMAEVAFERLSECGIIAGREMRHQASLSPVALQRLWNINLKVQQGKHNYILKGQANTYGRGLTLDIARVSCLMEMVERASAYASITEQGVLHKQENAEIFYGTRSSLLAQGYEVLDFDTLNLDIKYQDQALHFIKGEYPSCSGLNAPSKTVLVPMQLVYLFNNLDEPDLCDAPSSTGLAAGKSLTEAKISALTEVLERDAEATHIYHKKLCFNIQTQDQELLKLFSAYRYQGINIQFQDLSGQLGMPCVKCFVIGNKGQVYRATGAGLDAKRALISALTETPFPFPDGPSSGPGLKSLEQVSFEALPSYRLSSPELTLTMLEELLIENELTPIYINLTRSDLSLPVVKAIIPNLYTNSELDENNKIPYRLYSHYLKLNQNS
ncbi:YcaO-like family protein [Desulfovibrio litoralis]|uniref:YcaO-type kinase domain-containing protein n=1 Tax=Desulfovibrio litoralis DSM 11393 TaxID=1121455 RepID=A0A1M7RV53_9BACT|nr:YcaO-like family protein [Desulfovibrio litoralis]SHN50143.1 YcaO-type kinase domain-containing protein [Desulfovibrio litoralis DSM 11393]